MGTEQGGWVDTARVLLPGLTGGVAAGPVDFAARAPHLPGVGLVVGALGSAVLWGAGHVWPAAVAVLLSAAAVAWATGAMHERGLAAACGARNAGEPSVPAIVVVLVLGLRLAALHGLATRDFGATLALLPVLHAWSRAVPAALLLAGGAPGRWPAWTAGVALATVPPLLGGVAPTVLLEGAVGVLLAALVAARAWRASPTVPEAARVGLAQQGSEVVLALVLLAALARG